VRAKEFRVLDRQLSPIAQIHPPAWCLAQLRTVTAGTLLGDHDHAGWSSSGGVACVAEQDDLVFVVLEQPERTWSLVWSEVTVEVTGRLAGGDLWLVRVRGMCEREPLPRWGGPTSNPPPYGLRIRDAVVTGYSELGEELVDQEIEEQAVG
jgi:hypothetical protein